MMSDEKRFAVSNDDINRAIILTWSNSADGGVSLSSYERQQLERIVGEMARAIRTEPDRIDAATNRIVAELAIARSEIGGAR